MNSNNKWNYMPSLHAEIDAYNKIKNCKHVPKKMDLFVIRITNGGNLAESRPCYHCIDILSKSRLDIRDVYYSTSGGTIVCETFKNLKLNSKKYITTRFLRK